MLKKKSQTIPTASPRENRPSYNIPTQLQIIISVTTSQTVSLTKMNVCFLFIRVGVFHSTLLCRLQWEPCHNKISTNSFIVMWRYPLKGSVEFGSEDRVVNTAVNLGRPTGVVLTVFPDALDVVTISLSWMTSRT